MKPARYIAIEGPIGVGKTTLAHRLATTLGMQVLAEEPDENPFLGAFYDHPRANALSAQLFFLLQRARQVDSLRQADLFAGGCVADFMFDKDPLFAKLTLSGPELALYRDIYERLSWQAPRPDCVIYLDAPVSVLMARIATRNRHAERNLARAYLTQVVAAYRDYFADYSATPIVRVDADRLDLVAREADFEALLVAIGSPVRDQQLLAGG